MVLCRICGARYRGDEIEARVWREVTDLLADPNRYVWRLQDTDGIHDTSDSLRADLAACQNRLALVVEKEAKLAMGWLEQHVSQEAVDGAAPPVKAGRAFAEEQAERITARLASLDRAVVQVRPWRRSPARAGEAGGDRLPAQAVGARPVARDGVRLQGGGRRRRGGLAGAGEPSCRRYGRW